MAIGEQFAGLNMQQLIGGPLSAAADASTQLAASTADFINDVGFDKEGKLRTVAFGYQKRSMNDDGTSNLDEMKVEVPMLAITPIPNLQIDEVNILFDMEVKQSERSESSRDMSASMSGSARLGFIRVNISGSVSSHSSNTRSTDNSAKYHVDVRATNHGTPEGLARVLDMMAANVAPALVGSTLKNGDGQNLSEKARIRAERLKALRQSISQTESRLSAARDGLNNSLEQLKKFANSQLNIYLSQQAQRIGEFSKTDGDIKQGTENADKGDKTGNKKGKPKNEAAQETYTTQETYTNRMNELSQGWSAFQSQVGDHIKIIADSKDEQEEIPKIFALKMMDKSDALVDYASEEAYYSHIAAAQKAAVASQKKVTEIEEELFKLKAEYNDASAAR